MTPFRAFSFMYATLVFACEFICYQRTLNPLSLLSLTFTSMFCESCNIRIRDWIRYWDVLILGEL